MPKLLPLLTLLLCASACAQLRADIRHDSPAGQATMRVFDGGKLLFQATTKGLNAVTESKFSADGKWLLNIADGSGYVQLWDVQKGKRVKTFLAPFARVVRADFMPVSQHFYLNFQGTEKRPDYLDTEGFAQQSQASLWSLNPLRRVNSLIGFNSDEPTFSADSRRMAFTGWMHQGQVRVFDTRTGTLLSVLPRLAYAPPQRGGVGVQQVSLSPDGLRALVLSVDGRLAEYDASTGKLLKVRGKVAEAEAKAQLERFAQSGK